MAGNKVGKNLIVGVGCRFLILAMGIFLPRLLLVNFGSETNGLLSTITQVFSYVALLEAGIGNATLNALYQPISCDDRTKVTEIMASSLRLYRKTTIIYAACVVLLSAVLPFALESGLSKSTIALVTLLQGAAGMSDYFFVAVYKQLFMADGKNYFVENSQLLVHLGSTVGKIVLVSFGANVIHLQLCNLLVTWIGILFLRTIAYKKYRWLKLNTAKSFVPLKERNAFVVHEISGTIFSCTDVVVISTFCGLAASSVYAVYNLVFASLNTLISTVVSGTTFLLGQAYAKGNTFFGKMYDVYERLYTCLVFSIMTIACSLTIPFVKLYTAGVTDIQYVDTFLPYLFALTAALSACRATASRAVAISGHAGRTQGRAILEMAINLSVSVLLVIWLGIHGALLGTLAALLYRVTDFLLYANHKILNRSCVKSAMFFAGLFLLSSIEVVLLQIYTKNIQTYLQFFVYGVVITSVVIVVNFAMVFLLVRKDLLWIRTGGT